MNTSLAKGKRITVSLDAKEYERLGQLARGHKPPLSLSYLVRYAVELLLEKAEDPHFSKALRDPRGGHDDAG